MRVLAVHNRYLHRGGEAAAYEAECQLLEERGWRVDRFEESNRRIEELGRLRAAGRAVWSPASARELARRLRRCRYDLVHVHNFFPLLSPAVHHAAAAAGVPVVQTLHNYRLLCPAPTPYRDGRVCNDCLTGTVPWPGVRHACYRGSRAASAAVAAMITTHRLLGTWRRKVSAFIALSEFARDRFIAGGLPRSRVAVKPNVIPGVGDEHARQRKEFVLFAGRLTAAKGVRTLLAAWSGMREPPPLVVAGDGELATEVAAAAEASPRVRWVGRRTHEEVRELMAICRLLVVPAESWENCPMVTLEAAAHGTPVIATNLGSVGEIAGRDLGYVTVPPGRPDALADAVVDLYSDRERLERLAAKARSAFAEKFGDDANYRRLMEIYARALGCPLEAVAGG